MGNFSGKTDGADSNQSSPPKTDDSQAKKPQGKYKVQLAASVLGGTGPFTAYHTSVLIDGREYFFDMNGVMSSSNLMSHSQAPGNPIITDMGYTNHYGCDLERKLRPFFAGGSYDLLRKNCNSFSDCALWYLCRERLPGNYNRMEKLGNSEMLGSLVQSGEYKANPKADDFDKDKVLDACKGVFEKSEGLQVGGQNVESKDDMKAKRLAMLEKRMGMK